MTMRHIGQPPSALHLLQQGAKIKAHFRPSAALITAGVVADQQKAARVLIDTGADQCCVLEDVCKELGIQPVRTQKVRGVHGVEDRPVYPMQIGVVMHSYSKGQPASQPVIMWHGFDVIGATAEGIGDLHGIIGRNLLALFRFVYDGPAGTFEIVDYKVVIPPSVVAAAQLPKPSAARTTPKRNKVR
jgi:hypothetical protein